MQELVHQLIIGLSIGATYALIALGYTMVYGVLRLINFAHGEVYMAGAVVGWYLARRVALWHLPTWLGLTVVFGGAMVACAVLGFAIEVLAYRPLRARPRLVVLITAIGVSLLLQNLAQSNLIFGPTPRSFPNLIEVKTVFSFHIGNTVDAVPVSNLDVLSLTLSLVLMAGMTWIVLKTKVGLA